ncbi:hypothetical protein LJC34_01400 [Oscillospiraceae bacterium OttesenSCG-928-G22]|nr:hypothetical protein [Oscillospiraceae bacterium OttesenSCG-928-G22]
MNKHESTVSIKCDCNCSMFVVEKTVWEDGEVNYNITVQDSRYDHNSATAWGRVKSAVKILFGKPLYYNDVYIEEPDKFKKFVDGLNAMCLEDK